MPNTATLPMSRRFSTHIFDAFLITGCLALAACSPPDSTPKIAEEQREALDNARQAAEAIEQTAADRLQDIDVAGD